MRHCPECRRLLAPPCEICPECWIRLEPGAPPDARHLSLVYETHAFYEADMLETLLRDEGIPCLRVPARGALPWSLAGLSALSGLRLYVRADLAPLASELISEVTGGRETEA